MDFGQNVRWSVDFPGEAGEGAQTSPLRASLGFPPLFAAPLKGGGSHDFPSFRPFRDAHLAEVGDFELILDESVFGSALLNLA